MSRSRSVKRSAVLIWRRLGVEVALIGVIGLGVSSGVMASSASAPMNTSPPTISGTPAAGQTLTASQGTWSGSTPLTYGYVWRRCDSTGGSCSSISGATGSTYALTSADVGNTVRVRVTATNADGATSSTSVPTAVIAAATATTTASTTTATTSTTTASTTTTAAAAGCTTTGATVPVADVASPAHLAIDETQISPSTVTYATRSVTVRFHVSACGGSVQGALVYVTAVPYGQFGIPNEQATGSDGWATLQLSALRGYPVSKVQQLLVMFVRARKPGENVLGGISARRLVSFHVTHG